MEDVAESLLTTPDGWVDTDAAGKGRNHTKPCRGGQKYRSAAKDGFDFRNELKFYLLSVVLWIAGTAVALEPSIQPSPSQSESKAQTSAKHDVGSGAGDIGKGTANGVGSAAKGTGKAAGDLVTLHPISAATDSGRAQSTQARTSESAP